MLATNLGLRLRLPMPLVDVIDVSDWLIDSTDDLRVELGRASIPCSCGRQLPLSTWETRLTRGFATIFLTLR